MVAEDHVDDGVDVGDIDFAVTVDVGKIHPTATVGIGYSGMAMAAATIDDDNHTVSIGNGNLAVAVDALAIFKPTVTCHDGIVVSSFFVVLMLYFRLDDFDMILTT